MKNNQRSREPLRGKDLAILFITLSFATILSFIFFIKRIVLLLLFGLISLLPFIIWILKRYILYT